MNRIQKRACILQESVAGAPPDHLASGADVHETFRLRLSDPQDFTDILGNAPEYLFGSPEIDFAPLPINELADLTSEDGEQFQQLLVLAPDRAAEELYYAENFPACGNRKRKGTVEPLLCRDSRPRKISIEADVRNPSWLPTCPYAPRQADARRKFSFTYSGFECRKISG